MPPLNDRWGMQMGGRWKPDYSPAIEATKTRPLLHRFNPPNRAWHQSKTGYCGWTTRGVIDTLPG